jgi:hypothetical protein
LRHQRGQIGTQVDALSRPMWKGGVYNCVKQADAAAPTIRNDATWPSLAMQKNPHYVFQYE